MRNIQTKFELQKKVFGGNGFLGAIYLGRIVVPSPKIVKNISRTYEKVHCTMSIQQLDHSAQTDILLLLFKHI